MTSIEELANHTVTQKQLDELSISDLVAFRAVLKRIYDTVDMEISRLCENKRFQLGTGDILISLSSYFAELIDQSMATLIAKVPLNSSDAQLRARAIIAYSVDFDCGNNILRTVKRLKADLEWEDSQPNNNRGRC